jgi:hypothetical protein
MMTRDEYMNADKLTNGSYDGSKGQEIHDAYYGQFVSPVVTEIVLETFGADTLLASRDCHLNDIPLRKWDDMPNLWHMEKKIRAAGENMSLSTKVCIYKVAARRWLKANGGLPLWRVRYSYPTMPGDDPCILYSFAVGSDPDDALENFKRINPGTVSHEIVDNGGTPLAEKVRP